MLSVDPLNIPNTLRPEEIEDWIVFTILVANKEATQTRRKLDLMWATMKRDFSYLHYISPFTLIAEAIRTEMPSLMQYLREIKCGQYKRIERALTEAIKLDIYALTVSSLEAVHGIGPKSARMIMLYTQPDFQGVPLDTHILKHLASLGYEGVPKSTPPAGVKYQELEQLFVAEANKAGMTVKQYDTLIWNRYALSTRATT